VSEAGFMMGNEILQSLVELKDKINGVKEELKTEINAGQEELLPKYY
jgi:hypothetical protein